MVDSCLLKNFINTDLISRTAAPWLTILSKKGWQNLVKWSKQDEALHILRVSAPIVDKKILEGILLQAYGKRTIKKLKLSRLSNKW